MRSPLALEEGISSNILAARLAMLTDAGIITRTGDPKHRLKAIYSLTDKGIALLPVMAQISRWSRTHMPVDPALAATGEARDRAGSGLRKPR